MSGISSLNVWRINSVPHLGGHTRYLVRKRHCLETNQQTKRDLFLAMEMSVKLHVAALLHPEVDHYNLSYHMRSMCVKSGFLGVQATNDLSLFWAPYEVVGAICARFFSPALSRSFKYQALLLCRGVALDSDSFFALSDLDSCGRVATVPREFGPSSSLGFVIALDTRWAAQSLWSAMPGQEVMKWGSTLPDQCDGQLCTHKNDETTERIWTGRVA